MMDISTDEGEEHYCVTCKSRYGKIIGMQVYSVYTWKQGIMPLEKIIDLDKLEVM
jgi:hypothetical protein